MKIGKRQGGASIGLYVWENDGDVVEVPSDMALELLALKNTDHFLVDETENVDQGEIRPAEIHAADPTEAGAGDPKGPEIDPILRATQDVLPADERPPIRGSVASIVEWVGTDKIRAAAALRAERDYRAEVRPSLDIALRQVIDS